MNILLIGKPGSGKGTLSNDLKNVLPVFHMSTGDLLREEVRKGTLLGQKIDALISKGQFADIDTVFELVNTAMQEHQDKVILMDGFPRDVSQVERFLQHNHIDLVVVKEADDQTVFQRITGRLMHPGSGRVYHAVTMPPQVTGMDDVTGEPLITRDDDKAEFVQRRLDTFHSVTEPIIDFVRQHGIAPIIYIPEDADREAGVRMVMNTIYEIQRDLSASSSLHP